MLEHSFKADFPLTNFSWLIADQCLSCPIRQNHCAAMSRYGSAAALHVSLLMKPSSKLHPCRFSNYPRGWSTLLMSRTALFSGMSRVDISGILLSQGAWELGPDSVLWHKFPEFHCLKFSVAKRVLDYLHGDNICRRNGLNFKREKGIL